MPLREFNTTYKSRFMQKSYLNGTILMWWYFLLASLIKSVNSVFASLLSPFLLSCSHPRAHTNTLIHSHEYSLAHKFTNSPYSKAHLFPPSPTYSLIHAFRSLLAVQLSSLVSLFLMSFRLLIPFSRGKQSWFQHRKPSDLPSREPASAQWRTEHYHGLVGWSLPGLGDNGSV